jgi:hypothetical protein
VVVERELDLDGDGRLDVLVVARGPQGLDVSAYWNRGERTFDLLSRSAPVPAEELAAFEPLPLGQRPGFVLDALEDSPDEADHRLAIFSVNSGGLALVLETRFRQVHSEEDAGREPEEIVDLGGRPMGLEVSPASDPGAWPQVRLRHEAKSVLFGSGLAKPIRVVLGSSVQSFVSAGGRYRLDSERFDDYLAPLEPARVSASIQAPAEALGRAVDGDPASGWEPGSPEAELELGWGGVVAVRAVRLVLRCEESGDARRVLLALGDQPPLLLDRDQPGELDPAMLGLGDFDLQGAVQTLVFLRQPARVDRLRVRVETVAPAGAGICLGEVTPLSARVDETVAGPGGVVR